MTPLLENILNQPAALRSIATYQADEGSESLVRAAALLKGAKRIIVTGMGASFYGGVEFSYAIGAEAVEASELLYFRKVERDTAVVLVSRSGESVEVTKLLRDLRESGIQVIGVSNVRSSTLANNSDVSIVVASPPDQMVAIQTYSGTVAIFALLGAVLRNDFDDAVRDLLVTAHGFDSWIPSCVERRHEWDEFLTAAGPCYVLGRGGSLGSVAEGVLLMHETAKRPAVGMSVAQFRHGPVEAVDSDFHGVILGTQPQTVQLEAALANDVTEMGGNIRWLGPSTAAVEAPTLCPWPDVPTRYRGLAEVVPLQCLAYRKAELMGVHPGAFRWAPQVTTTESGFSLAHEQ